MELIGTVLFLTLAWGIPLLVFEVLLAVGASIFGKPSESGSRLGAQLSKRLSFRGFVIPLAVIVIVHFAAGLVLADAKTRELRKRIQEAPMVRVRTGGMCHKIPNEVVLHETSDRQKIADLAECLRVAPGILPLSCACCGEMTFETDAKDGRSFAFSYHHGTSVRVAGWGGGDRDLTGSARASLEQWLVNAGVDSERRQEADSERARRRHAGTPADAPITTPVAAEAGRSSEP